MPDDTGHLIAVELDNRILDLDLGHRNSPGGEMEPAAERL
jgi:hypothetical protein